MHLSSPNNPILRKIRRASKEGTVTDGGSIVIEGPHLLAEVLNRDNKWALDRIFTTPAGRDRYENLLQNAGAEITEVSARAFRSLAATETTQEIIALVKPPHWSWTDVMSTPGIVLVLDGVQDPGNAGTLVRSAEAFGVTGLTFLDGCVGVANGKFLRATAGSIFRIPFLEGISRVDLAAEITRGHFRLYALTAGGQIPIAHADFGRPCALVVGSEGRGISPEVLASAQTVRLPTSNVESLNAAVAGSIALFEAARQRQMA